MFPVAKASYKTKLEAYLSRSYSLHKKCFGSVSYSIMVKPQWPNNKSFHRNWFLQTAGNNYRLQKYFLLKGSFFFFSVLLPKISKLFDFPRTSFFIRQCIHSTFQNEFVTPQQTVQPVSSADSITISSIMHFLPSLQGTAFAREHSHKMYLSVKIIYCLRCKYLQYGG